MGEKQVFGNADDLDSMVSEAEPFQLGGVSPDQVEWATLEDCGLTMEMIEKKFKRTMLWTLLVMPKQPRRQSKGGIILPDQAVDAEQSLTYVGKVIALGPLVGASERYKDRDGKYQYELNVGDWIIYGRYAGQPIIFRGVTFHTIYDDMVRHVIDGPEDLRMYV